MFLVSSVYVGMLIGSLESSIYVALMVLSMIEIYGKDLMYTVFNVAGSYT